MTNEERASRQLRITENSLAAATADASDRVRNQLSLAQELLRSLLLANGGAMVALFSFLGNLLAKSAHLHFVTGRLYTAFGLFVLGFTLGLASYFMAFFSQDRFYMQSSLERFRYQRHMLDKEPDAGADAAEITVNRQGYRFFVGGIALAAASVLCFFAGSGCALSGVLL